MWFEKSFAVQLDMVVSIDILQFQPNWCRITACHAILLIGYYAKNGNPLRAWHFAESWIWYTTFFLSSNVRTGFYIIAMLCELSQHWLHREVLCPIISDKCSFPSTELPVRPIDWTGTFFPALTLGLCFSLFIAPFWHKIGIRWMLCICRIQWAKIYWF